MKHQPRTMLVSRIATAITFAALGIAIAGPNATSGSTAAPSSTVATTTLRFDGLRCLHRHGATPCRDLSI